MMRPLLRGDYDIFHSHCYRQPHGEMVSLLARNRNIPAILHVHGGFYAQGGMKDTLYGVYDYLAKKHIVNRFTHYIALTDDSKKKLHDRGVVHQQVTVIPNAVADECLGEITADDFRDRYGLTGKRIMLFLGSLHRLKRPDLLIPVLSKVCARVPEAFLLYVGPDAGEYAKVDKRAKDLQVDAHVKWIGPLQGKEKQQALEAADFLMLPADEEPFGIVLLEAMAHRKPVIASSTEGARAIIENKVTGFITPCGSVDDLAEAALQLLMRKDLCREMGRKARQAVTGTYRIPAAVDHIEEVYYRLLTSPNQGDKPAR
jgi:glycosyltransferase involved in cell wall biosynthesis